MFPRIVRKEKKPDITAIATTCKTMMFKVFKGGNENVVYFQTFVDKNLNVKNFNFPKNRKSEELMNMTRNTNFITF